MSYAKKSIAKIILCGDGAVGKTTLAQNLTGTLNLNEERKMTPGIDVHLLKTYSGLTKAQIIDLGGQEQFRFFQQDFCRGADIAVFVFSLEWYHSFMNVVNWLELFNTSNVKKCILVGNKADSDNRVISYNEAKEFAESLGMDYIEVSAITGHNCKKLRESLQEEIVTMFDEIAQLKCYNF